MSKMKKNKSKLSLLRRYEKIFDLTKETYLKKSAKREQKLSGTVK